MNAKSTGIFGNIKILLELQFFSVSAASGASLLNSWVPFLVSCEHELCLLFNLAPECCWIIIPTEANCCFRTFCLLDKHRFGLIRTRSHTKGVDAERARPVSAGYRGKALSKAFFVFPQMLVAPRSWKITNHTNTQGCRTPTYFWRISWKQQTTNYETQPTDDTSRKFPSVTCPPGINNLERLSFVENKMADFVQVAPTLSKFPLNSKSLISSSPVSTMLICPLCSRFAQFKEFYLVFLFRIKPEVPALRFVQQNLWIQAAHGTLSPFCVCNCKQNFHDEI